MHHDEQLKLLSPPTVEQTSRFAEHVADNHSWYKHFPFFPPGASFVFYPNPHAGRGLRYEGDQLVTYEISKGDYFAHHGRLPTAEYLANFGNWDYRVEDNPRVLDPVPGPLLFLADADKPVLLADHLTRSWSCRVTAFLNPSPSMISLREHDYRQEADDFVASIHHSPWHKLLELFHGPRAVDPMVDRYRAALPMLSHRSAAYLDVAVRPFMLSESRTQREHVLSTLLRIRTWWAGD